MIILIALLSGVVVTIVSLFIVEGIGRLRIQRRISTNVGAVFAVYNKGLAGNLLFIAERIGRLTHAVEHPRMAALLERIRIHLTIMGEPYCRLEPRTFVGIQALAGVGAVVVAIVALGLYSPISWIIFLAAGSFVPYALLSAKVKERHRAVFRQIPDALDYLVLMMDAGLDFTRAFDRLLALEKGPLIDEMKVARQEIAVGRPRAEALQAVAGRLQYPPVTSVIGALNSALKTGGSMAEELRVIAEQFRVERFQMAEKMAGEAPLKLMMPLILLIFPTIFIILFGPVILSFLGGGLF